MMRYDILIRLLRGKGHINGVEIGVNNGECSAALLRGLTNLGRLTCVDPWQEYEGDDWFSAEKRDAERSFSLFLRQVVNVYGVRVRYMKEMSETAVSKFEDESLDFVFIDGNHQYEWVKKDIEMWVPKVKPGGLIAGHDYCQKPYGIGVHRAVNEYFGDGNFEHGADVTWWKWKEATDGDE